MSHEAVVWTFLATLFAGFHITTSKIVAHKNISGPVNSLFNFGLSGIFFGILFLVSIEKTPTNFSYIILLMLCAGAMYGISFTTRIQSLKNIDSVIFFPINKILGPIIAVMGGVLIFSESLTSIQYLGIFFSVCVPLLLINYEENKRQNNLYLGSIFLIISTFTGAVNNMFTKEAFVAGAGIFFLLFWGQFFAFFISLAIALHDSYKKEIRIKISKEDLKFGTITSILSGFSVFSLLKAIQTGPYSLVYTIHAHYILIPIIFSVFFYKEHINFKKVCAVVLSMVAIAFLI